LATQIVYISATFTAEPIQDPLEFWLNELGLSFSVQFAPYNQVFQQLLDPTAVRGAYNVALIRLEDFGSAGLEDNLVRLIDAARSYPAPLLICFCPGNPGAKAHHAAETRVARELQGPAQVVTSRELQDLYPVADYFDRRSEELGHVPYTPAMFAALGTMVARQLRARLMPPAKVIALDCDDTLWSGVCGEDGPQGVRIEEWNRQLQQCVLQQKQAGALVVLCSKNIESDVQETFAAHPEMPLQWKDIAAWRINWEPKPGNLQSLAQELNLGLDSFVFIDDNPREAADVQARVPEVTTVVVPSDKPEQARFLRHLWPFDRWRVTSEDRRRTDMYLEQRERRQLQRTSASFAEFLQSLRLKIDIAPMTTDELPRVSQLTLRTNQMNFSSIRRSEADISTLLENEDAECLTVHVSDRFGTYGLTGVILFRTGSDALTIDTFLLSCRALGRGVEHRMMAKLGEIAQHRGVAWVEAQFVRTARNEPAEKFLASINGPRFKASELARLKYEPPGEPVMEELEEVSVSNSGASLPYQRFASEWSDPEAVLAAIRESKAAEALLPRTTPAEEPRTETEVRLAQIWGTLLHIAPPGVHDNFFDLGGHSLLAIQLLSIVHKEFGVEVPLSVVYGSNFTVSELARTVELQQLEGLSAEEYAALLQDLESMTDEEAAALLEQEREQQ
jgi:FkbH-like protein